jgi:hypothetical protein
MKTAMQELIEYIELNIDDNDFIKHEVLEQADKLLEKEKDQINVSFISGTIEALSYHTPVRDRIKDGYFEDKAEQYFNHTYKEINND